MSLSHYGLAVLSYLMLNVSLFSSYNWGFLIVYNGPDLFLKWEIFLSALLKISLFVSLNCGRLHSYKQCPLQIDKKQNETQGQTIDAQCLGAFFHFGKHSPQISLGLFLYSFPPISHVGPITTMGLPKSGKPTHFWSFTCIYYPLLLPLYATYWANSQSLKKLRRRKRLFHF